MDGLVNISNTRELVMVAGQSYTVSMEGSFLRCLSGATFDVELGSSDMAFSGAFPMEVGSSVSVPFRFERVRLTSPSSQTIRLFSFFGDYRDDRLIAGEDFAVNTKPLGYTMTTGAPVSALAGACTLIAAVNASRRYLGLYNEGVETLYVRENSTASKSPLVLAPGAFLPVPLNSAIYAYNPGTTPCTLQVAEFV